MKGLKRKCEKCGCLFSIGNESSTSITCIHCDLKAEGKRLNIRREGTKTIVEIVSINEGDNKK